MPRNGTGVYSLPQPPFVAGTVISSSAVNSDLSDIASALTASLPRDGQAGMAGQFKAVDGSIVTPSISFNNEGNSGFFRVSAGVLGVSIEGVQVSTIDSGGIQGTAPIGAVNDFAGSAAPSKWLLCFGQAVSRTTYALLFAIIGTVFGSGDGVNTFNIPDLRGVNTTGKDDMGGVAAGRLTTSFFGTDPKVLGNFGGAQSRTLSTPNLPAYTPAGSVGLSGNITGTGFSLGVNHSNTPEAIVLAFPGGAATPLVWALTPNMAASFTGTAQGGTSTAFSDVQPSLILNKIIFAGV